MHIQSVDRDVRELLASNFYRIPRFQRPYSWDLENIEEFWSDVAGAQRADADYFIGSMVVYSERGDINIVDGQQRLTTIAIAICALRDVFEQEGFHQLALGAQSLIERNTEDNVTRYVVSTESSYPYFQNRVLSFGNRPVLNLQVGPEEENIQVAYDSLKTNIAGAIAPVKAKERVTDDERRQQIEQTLVGIRNRILSLKLILIRLTDEDDAYVIFETINTRGKDLSVSDLLRNFFTRHLRAPNLQADTAKIQWQNVLHVINQSSAELVVDTYLHHHWLSRHSYVTLKELFKKIKDEIHGAGIQGYLDELERDAATYRLIHETTYATWQPHEVSIQSSLKAFLLFRVRQQTPFVLTLLRDYKAGHLKFRQVAPVLRSLESFHFLFNAVTQQRSSGGISMMFASSAIQLDQADSSQRKQVALRELVTKLRQRVPLFDVVRVNFREIIFTNTFTKNRSLVRYILSRFDEAARPGVTLDYSTMTIEHLCPQNPDGQPLPDNILGMMGNLILAEC
ncbi:MAG: DUF262 domain-containing protein [Ignavibacteriales bacterium]|nr:DUF262 domain-containing protein [Ignavibacteriales bacterium]